MPATESPAHFSRLGRWKSSHAQDFQRTKIQVSSAALHSPAPFDRLGGGLVVSFNELMLSDDNSANIRHFSEKNANYMKFNVL
jgi:hypothetical protein